MSINMSQPVHAEQKYSAVHRVIDIPELLESIIHFLDTSDCVAAACVAHTWTSPALDRIWRSLPKMYNVLSLLGQLDAGDFDDYLNFDEPDTPLNLSRYLPVAHRVRELDYNEYRESPSLAMVSTTTAALERVGVKHLFPGLRHLTWKSSNDREELIKLAAMLSPTIESFIIQIHRGGGEAAANFIAAVRDMLPQDLREFKMRIRADSTQHLFTPDSVAGLESALQPLRRLTCLDLLTTDVPVSLLSWVGQNCQLRRLHLGHRSVSWGERKEFLTALVEACPMLEELWLTVFLPPPVHGQEQEHNFSFKDLYPLLKLRNFEIFELGLNHPLVLSTQDIRGMGEAWPCLRKLSLLVDAKPESKEDDAMQATPMTRLSDFAEAFSNRLVGLCHVFSIDLAQLQSAPTKHHFSHLEQFNLGTTPVNHGNLRPLASYLSQLLPVQCRLYCHEDEGWGKRYNPLWNPWGDHGLLTEARNNLDVWQDLELAYHTARLEGKAGSDTGEKESL